MPPSSYPPYRPARRPGGRPAARPRYRVLVHRQFFEHWQSLPNRVGLESAQQFYDHVATSPGQIPAVGMATILKGALGRPIADGFSRTIHYEISGAGRIDYQFHDAYVGLQGDPHAVVFILRISLGSH